MIGVTRLTKQARRIPGIAASVGTLRDYVSPSAISTYQTCPLRYFFRYVVQYREPVISASLVFGAAIHAALESHFRAQLHGKPAPTLSELQEVYLVKWGGFASQTVRFGQDDDRESLDSLAERMLGEFQKSDCSRLSAGARILGIEEELSAELVAGCPPILGRVDLLIETPESLIVTDFKTSRCRWSAEHVAESADQLLLYHELVEPLSGGKPIQLEFVVLTKTKTPVVARHAVEVNRDQIDRTKRIVGRIWNSISSGAFYPCPSVMNCAGCPFREPCRQWQG